MIECEILEMIPGKKTILEFEYSGYLSGGILTPPPLTVEDSNGAIISLGASSISGTKVLVLVTAVSSGRAIITCTVSTSLGAVAIDDQEVFVK